MTPEQTTAVFGEKSISRRFLEPLRDFAICNTLSLDFGAVVALIQKARDERQTEKGVRGISRKAEFLAPDVRNALKSARSDAIQLKMKGVKEPKGAKRGAGKVNGNTAGKQGISSKQTNGVGSATANVRQGKRTAARAQDETNEADEVY